MEIVLLLAADPGSVGGIRMGDAELRGEGNRFFTLAACTYGSCEHENTSVISP
jgi:hypothetical protein